MTRTDTEKPQVDYVTLTAAYALLIVAFYFSYGHVQHAVEAWGQTGQASYGIAAMPEVTVFIGMRKLLAGQASPFVYAVLASAGAFTLAGNLQSAQHSIGGMVAAGWPAYSAITALVLSGVHGSRARTVEGQGQAEGQIEDQASRTRITVERVSAKRTVTPKPRAQDHAVILADVTPEPQAQDHGAILDAEIVTPEPVTLKPVREITAGPESVTLWLTENWSPERALTAEVKAECVRVTGVSEATVKRAARAIKAQAQV